MEHPNIIKSYGAYLLGDSVWLPMEYCVGSIQDILKLTGSMREEHIATICDCVLQGGLANPPLSMFLPC